MDHIHIQLIHTICMRLWNTLFLELAYFSKQLLAENELESQLDEIIHAKGMQQDQVQNNWP